MNHIWSTVVVVGDADGFPPWRSDTKKASTNLLQKLPDTYDQILYDLLLGDRGLPTNKLGSDSAVGFALIKYSK